MDIIDIVKYLLPLINSLYSIVWQFNTILFQWRSPTREIAWQNILSYYNDKLTCYNISLHAYKHLAIKCVFEAIYDK